MKLKRYNAPYILSVLFFSSLGFSQFYFEIGFALKPYMIVASIILAYMLFTMRRLRSPLSIKGVGAYDYMFVLFLTVLGLSFLWSQYPDQSVRFSANALLIFFVYLILRIFYSNFIDLKTVAGSIKISACIIFISNIVYYFIGLVEIGFNFTGNGIITNGLMIDRGYPRLIGTVSTDPNFAALVLSAFFAFIVLQSRSYSWKAIGLVAVILTFSRGAYLSIVVSFLAFGILSRVGFRKILLFARAALVVCLGVLLLLGVGGGLVQIEVGEVISSRVNDSLTDGGTGRSTLWANALKTFSDHPVMGIGANATQYYNIDTYMDSHYNHNTYLDILSELGLLGFSIFILFMVTLLMRVKAVSASGSQYPLLLFFVIFATLTFLTAMTNEMILFLVLVTSIYSIGSNYKSAVKAKGGN